MRYFIGEGVRYQIARLDDVAKSDEVFLNDRYSITSGEKYLYYAHKVEKPDEWIVYVASRNDLAPTAGKPAHTVTVDYEYPAPISHIAGWFESEPKRVILHSTRSDTMRGVDKEYWSNCAYLVNNKQVSRDGSTYHLGWNATIGHMRYAPHINIRQWGWNARGASSIYPGFEFAQSAGEYNAGMMITDGQVIAFVAYAQHIIKPAWPNLYQRMMNTDDAFIEHWQLPEGRIDGKSDVNPRMVGDLTRRIRAMMHAIDTIIM